MRTKCLGVMLALAALLVLACGTLTKSGPPHNPDICEQPPGCFISQAGCVYLDRSAILVANTGSSSVSVFQNPGPNSPVGLVCGSPFNVAAPPSGFAAGLPTPAPPVVVSSRGKTISFFKVDVVTSHLTGPTVTLTSAQTPVAATWCGNGTYLCVPNAEGSFSVYQIQSNGTASAEVLGSPFPAGSAPSSIAAYGNWVYVANSESNNISAYILDPATGSATPIPGSPFAAGVGPSSVQTVPLDPANGGLIEAFVANRGSNSISAYLVASNGSLAPVPGSPVVAGEGPSSIAANYNIYPLPFIFVANSMSNDISVLSIDDSTGMLTPVPGSPFPAGTHPSSVAVGGSQFAGFGEPGGAPFAYVSNAGSNDLSVYSVGQGGALTPVAGSPFPVGQSPSAVLYLQAPE